MSYPPSQPEWVEPQPLDEQAAAVTEPAAQVEAPSKKKSKGPIIVAAVVVVALVGAVVFALNMLRGGSAVAAKGIPDTAILVVDFNLKPAAGDQLALKNIAKKFPQVDTPDTADYKEAIWELIPDAEDKPAYSEIEPWLGDTLAFGFLSNGSMEDGTPVIAVQVKDKGKAEAFVKAQDANVTPFFVDDVMVIAPAEAGLSTDSLKGRSVADNAEYKADISALSGTHLATFWMSPRLMELGLKDIEQTSGLPAASIDQVRGMHGAAALQVSENELTLRAITSMPNATMPDNLPDVTDFAAKLDGSAPFAYAGSAVEESYTQIWEQLSTAPEFGDSFGALGITSASDLFAVFGTQMGITVSIDDNAMPVIGAQLTSPDPAKQKEIFDGILSMFADSGMQVALEQRGETGVVAFGQSVDNVVNPAVKLGDVDAYKKAVQGKSLAVAFVNVDAIEALPVFAQVPAEVSDWLKPISAMGMTSTSNPSAKTAEGVFRVVFN
ncbi:MAG: hypothetical protein QM713_04185 [Arachnia sp.]